MIKKTYLLTLVPLLMLLACESAQSDIAANPSVDVTTFVAPRPPNCDEARRLAFVSGQDLQSLEMLKPEQIQRLTSCIKAFDPSEGSSRENLLSMLPEIRMLAPDIAKSLESSCLN